jgi:hypothetical protein
MGIFTGNRWKILVRKMYGNFTENSSKSLGMNKKTSNFPLNTINGPSLDPTFHFLLYFPYSWNDNFLISCEKFIFKLLEFCKGYLISFRKNWNYHDDRCWIECFILDKCFIMSIQKKKLCQELNRNFGFYEVKNIQLSSNTFLFDTIFE